MLISRETIAFGFVLTAFGGGALFMFLAFSGPRDLPEHATLLPQSVPLPPFALLDHHGAPFDQSSFAGHWSLVFFGFTHCPDICPATLQQLAIARDRIAAEVDAEIPHIVLVSVDPERDTPATLADYVAHFGPDITGVTGDPGELRKLTSALGIYFEKSAAENDSYSIDHAMVVIVVNPAAEFRAVFRAPHKIENFVADVPRIVNIS
jgi:protein SCO1/2